MTATFADDTAIISNHANYDRSVENLQCSLDQITNWMKKWKIKSNSTSLRNHIYIPVKIDDDLVPLQENARYLGVHFDKKLNWRTHIIKKRDELNLRFRSLYWLFCTKNQLSLNNKRLLYVTILRPTWSYGIEIRGCATKSNLLVLQRFQNKVMRKMTGARWYIRNEDLHHDLNLETVVEVAKRTAHSYEKRLHNHPNPEAIEVLLPPVRRLQRAHPTDIV